MAKYNPAIELTFNDNDGGAGWRCHPDAAEDVLRHIQIFGKWRARWIFLKKFWKGLMWMEGYVYNKHSTNSHWEVRKAKLWVFKPEIPK